MMQVRARLEEYRRKKDEAAKAEERYQKFKNVFKRIFPFNTENKVQEINDNEDDKEPLIQPENLQEDKTEILENIDDKENASENSYLLYIKYFLYIVLWVTLYIIAIELEFGAVYFIISSFVLIWMNTRSGPKVQGEPSAYSVFNPNCEAIEGTLDASQFEREIRYGIGGMH